MEEKHIKGVESTGAFYEALKGFAREKIRVQLQDLLEQEVGESLLDELNDDNILTCYQQCDLFVLPNRQVGNNIAGFGMVLLEAQACGKSVVAVDSGETAETLKNPETGRVIPVILVTDWPPWSSSC